MTVYRFPGLERRSAGFVPELEAVARRLGTDPNFLAAVMWAESGIDPYRQNEAQRQQGKPIERSAYGLCQFTPPTLRAWGLTALDLAAQSDVWQLGLVERLFRPYRGRIDSATRARLLAFLPGEAYRPPGSALGVRGSTELVAPGLTRGEVYAANAGLDRAGDGVITLEDVGADVEAALLAARARGEFRPPAAAVDGGAGVAALVLVALAGAAVAVKGTSWPRL